MATSSGEVTLRMSVSTSPLSFLALNMASRTTATLRFHPSSFTPEPRPVTTTGSCPVNRPIITADGEVFPIPRSPAMSRSAPLSTSSSAIRFPTLIAATNSASVMASSTSMLPQERRTHSWSPTTSTSSSWSREMSTTRIPMPDSLAIALMPPPPALMLAAIWIDTSFG